MSSSPTEATESASPHAEAARAMLSDHPTGVDLYIQTELVGSSFTMIRCDHRFLEALLRRQAFCESEDLHETIQRTAPTATFFESDIDVVDWMLTVDSRTFKFHGTVPTPREKPVRRVCSQQISTAYLRRWIHGTPLVVDLSKGAAHPPIRAGWKR